MLMTGRVFAPEGEVDMQWFSRKATLSGRTFRQRSGDHARGARLARWLLMLPILVLMAASPGLGHAQPVPIRGPFTFVYFKSGGFIGTQEELIVDSASQRIRYHDLRNDRTESGRVTLAELQALRDALDEANFLRLRGPFLCGFCADQFMFDGRLRSPQGSNSVHWEEGSNAPAALRRIDALMDQWIRDLLSR
jgi:hypothetical protein